MNFGTNTVLFLRELQRHPLSYFQTYEPSEMRAQFSDDELATLARGEVVARTLKGIRYEFVSANALATLAFETQPAKGI